MEVMGILWRLITERQLNMCFQYEKGLKTLTEEETIKVENIKGPILLFSAQEDAVWPSNYSCQQITGRLKEKGFSHPVEHINYPYASHVLVPITDPKIISQLRFYRMERKHADQCKESREKTMVKTIEWLNQW